MPTERYYTDVMLLSSQQEIILEKQEFHHLAHVMRSKPGEEIELIDGHGSLANAVIKRISKHQANLEIQTVAKESYPSVELILVQGIPRINRLDFILEKATELGVTQIWLLPCALSERKTFTPHQIERFQALTIAAIKQCGRLYLPKITVCPPLGEWGRLPYSLFFGDLNSQAPLFKQSWHQKKPSHGTMLVVGPESGLTDKEITTLKDLGGIGVKLHSHILRTDTASIVGLGLISHWLIPTNT